MTMVETHEPRVYRVLVAENNVAAAVRIKALLESIQTTRFHVDIREWLQSAYNTAAFVAQSPRHKYDCVLLDLYLPNGQGIDAAATFMLKVPLVPVIVMAETRDIEIAEQCVMHGAQGYLVKDNLHPDILEIEILVAIQRQQRDIVNRKLFLQALDGGDGGGQSADLVREHVSELDAAVRELTQYIARDAPAHLAAARQILTRRNFSSLLLDAQGTLELAGQRFDDVTPVEGVRRDRKVSDTALKAVKEIVARRTNPPQPETTTESPADSSAQLLDIIHRRSSYSVG